MTEEIIPIEQIEKYGFEEGVDFFRYNGKSTGGRKMVDYIVTLECGFIEKEDFFINLRKSTGGVDFYFYSNLSKNKSVQYQGRTATELKLKIEN